MGQGRVLSRLPVEMLFAVAGCEPQSIPPAVHDRVHEGFVGWNLTVVKPECVMWAPLWDEVKIAIDMTST